MLQMSSGFVCYGTKPVVDVDTFEVDDSAVVLISGANGTGKTSLCRAVVGLAARFTGSMSLDGCDLRGLPIAQRIRFGLRYLPQGYVSFGRLTVAQHVALTHAMLGNTTPSGLSAERWATQVASWASEGMRTGHLSVGQARVLLLSSMLKGRPKLLMLDEPYAGLDPDNRDRVNELVAEAHARRIACVVVDHTGTVKDRFKDVAEHRLEVNREREGVFRLTR